MGTRERRRWDRDQGDQSRGRAAAALDPTLRRTCRGSFFGGRAIAPMPSWAYWPEVTDITPSLGYSYALAPELSNGVGSRRTRPQRPGIWRLPRCHRTCTHTPIIAPRKRVSSHTRKLAMRRIVLFRSSSRRICSRTLRSISRVKLWARSSLTDASFFQCSASSRRSSMLARSWESSSFLLVSSRCNSERIAPASARWLLAAAARARMSSSACGRARRSRTT